MKLNARTQLPENGVVLDTETTGFDPANGDRIVEIGAVRIRDGLLTGETFHVYINPERTVPAEAVEVHGLTSEFLADKPLFAEVAPQFLEFLGDDPFVAHNAPFDSKFINAELAQMGLPTIAADRVFDSIKSARRLFPGASANLNALCQRFKISLEGREKHGALIDSELLAEVMVEMGGGRQTSLLDSFDKQSRGPVAQDETDVPVTPVRTLLATVSPEDLERHAALVAKLGDASPWNQIDARDAA